MGRDRSRKAQWILERLPLQSQLVLSSNRGQGRGRKSHLRRLSQYTRGGGMDPV